MKISGEAPSRQGRELAMGPEELRDREGRWEAPAAGRQGLWAPGGFALPWSEEHGAF